jgi:recombination protein RecT
MIVYMVAHFKDGGSHFEWMTVGEVMRIKARSSAVRSGKQTPWDTDASEMIRKTVIRRGWKYLPMSIEMQNAEIIDSAIEKNQNVVIEGDSFVLDSETGEITPENNNDDEYQPQQITDERGSMNGLHGNFRDAVVEESGGTVLEQPAQQQARQRKPMDLG